MLLKIYRKSIVLMFSDVFFYKPDVFKALSLETWAQAVFQLLRLSRACALNLVGVWLWNFYPSSASDFSAFCLTSLLELWCSTLLLGPPFVLISKFDWKTEQPYYHCDVKYVSELFYFLDKYHEFVEKMELLQAENLQLQGIVHGWIIKKRLNFCNVIVSTSSLTNLDWVRDSGAMLRSSSWAAHLFTTHGTGRLHTVFFFSKLSLVKWPALSFLL